MTDTRGPRRPVQAIDARSTLRDEMEATARAHVAADDAQVDEAMASVPWERRGLLQRLTRGSR